MLSEKELIFFGACLILAGYSAHSGLSYIERAEISDAIDKSQCMFAKIFDNSFDYEEKTDDKMIIE